MLNVWLNVFPGSIEPPELNVPVILCDMTSLFVQVTLVPFWTLMIAGLNPLLVISTAFTVATVIDAVAVPVTVDTDVVIGVVTAAVDTGVVAYDVPVTFGVVIHVAVADGVSVTVVIPADVAVSIGITVSAGVIIGVISLGVPPVGWTVALGLVVGP